MSKFEHLPRRAAASIAVSELRCMRCGDHTSLRLVVAPSLIDDEHDEVTYACDNCGLEVKERVPHAIECVA